MDSPKIVWTEEWWLVNSNSSNLPSYLTPSVVLSKFPHRREAWHVYWQVWNCSMFQTSLGLDQPCSKSPTSPAQNHKKQTIRLCVVWLFCTNFKIEKILLLRKGWGPDIQLRASTTPSEDPHSPWEESISPTTCLVPFFWEASLYTHYCHFY